MSQVDPYVYPNSHILKNKLGIKDKDELIQVESQIIIAKLIDIDPLAQRVDFFDVSGIREIHRHLFEDIYEWAGEFRTINIFKEERVLNGLSVDYSTHNRIQADLKAVLAKASACEWTYGNKRLVSDFAGLMARLWRVHPYREGNTRCVSLYMKLFADAQGLEFDDRLLSQNAGYLRNALVLASIGEYSEPEHIERIIGDALQPEGRHAELEQSGDTERDYSHIGEYDVRDYQEVPFTTYEGVSLGQPYENLETLISKAKDRVADHKRDNQKIGNREKTLDPGR